MKNVIFDIITGLACLFFCIATPANAQSIRGKLEVKATNGAEAANVRYFYQDEQRAYTFTFIPAAQTDSITKAELIVNKTTITCEIKDGNIYIPAQTIPCSAVESGTDTFVLNYSYSAGKEEEGMPQIENATTESQKCNYFVYTKAENKSIVNIEGHKNGIGSIEKTILAEGIENSMSTGNPDGWSYYWEIDGIKQQDQQNSDSFEHTFIYSGSNEYKDYEVRLCMVNNIVNGTVGSSLRSAPAIVRVYKPLKAEILNNPRNMVVGHDKTFTVQLSGGQKEKWADVEFIVNNEPYVASVSGNELYTFTYTPTPADKDKTFNIIVTATNNPDDCDSDDVESVTANVKVWGQPTATCAFDTTLSFESKGGLGDHPLVVNGNDGCPNTSGSIKNGWYYEWKQDGRVILENTGSESTYKVPGDPSETINSTYSVTINHFVDNELVFEKKYSQRVLIWAKPTQPQYDAQAFSGETPQITVTTGSGYQGNVGGWRYTIKKRVNDEPVLENVTGETFTFEENLYCSAGREEDINDDYIIIAENYYKNESEPWDYFETPLLINVYAQPDITILSDNTPISHIDKDKDGEKTVRGTIEIYYNKNIIFSISKTLGIDGYWNTLGLKYVGDDGRTSDALGSVNNFISGETIKEVFSNDIINNTEMVQHGKITGSVTNGRGNLQKVWYIDLDVNIWPQVKWSDDNIASENGVREGDACTIVAPAPMRGGYQPNGASTRACYTYMIDGKVLNTASESSVYMYESNDISTMSSGTGKQTDTHDISVKVSAYGPMGAEWESKTYSKQITVYRRPQMPESIQQKGNGTSHTYIMTIPNSESRYESDYNYVLTDGTTVYYSGPLRYAVADSSINLKAACYWMYNNKVTIYSDFRLYGSLFDEYCGWSTFNGEGPKTRGTYDDGVEGIEDIVVDALPLAPMYDMQGRRVIEPKRGTMYLVNGKKMIFK